MWLLQILLSAVLLAFYDVSKKKSVHDNAVFSVLLYSSLCGFVFFIALLGVTGQLLDAARCEPVWICRSAVKAVMVGASWTFMFYALRSLPVSIAVPIRSSAPLWTVIGAILLFGEIPTRWQAAGMALIFAGYFFFSTAGKRDGIHFCRHRGIAYAFAATVLGAVCALYDKYLFGELSGPRETIQLYFSASLVVFFIVLSWIRRAFKLSRTPFCWRWTIPLVGVLLILSDFFYFRAVGFPDTHIATLTLIRRSSVAISFVFGVILFKEKNVPAKAFALLVLLAGVVLLCLSS